MDGSPYICVNTAEGAKILLNQERCIKLPLSYEKLVSPLLGKGLITSNISTWKPHRQALSSHFNSINLSNRHVEMTTTIAKILNRRILQQNTESEAAVFFKAVSLETNWKLLLGTDMNEEKAEQWNLLLDKFNPVLLCNKFLGSAAPLITHLAFPSFYKARDSMWRDLNHLVENIGAESQQTMLYEMISSEAFTREDIIDQCVTFLFAGHDSTANCISWTLYFLKQNPSVLQQLKQELDDGRINVNELSKDNYLKACVLETLRRAPPLLLLDRCLLQKSVIEGVELPANTPVAIGVYNIHHNPKYWENPYSYNPARFLNPKHPPFSFLGFSGGERNCLGKHWALIQVQVILLLLLTKYKYSLKTEMMEPTYAPFYQPSKIEIRFN